MPTRIPATEIFEHPERVIGRKLVEFSHIGEDPDSDARRIDTVAHFGSELPIVAVRRDDTDNHVAILLDSVLQRLWRDENRRARKGHFDDAGHPVFDDREDWLMVDTDPPEGKVEIGFDTNGWIEVKDE